MIFLVKFKRSLILEIRFWKVLDFFKVDFTTTSQKFCYILVRATLWTNQLKPWSIPAVVDSIMVVGALTRCTSIHTMCELKSVQMNVKRCPIRKLAPYKFKLDHNAAKVTKNICCAKKFLSGCKNFDDQAGASRTKSEDFEVILQAIEVNPTSSTRRVSGELNISQSSKVLRFHKLGKNIRRYQIESYGLASLFKDISTFVGYLMPKPSFSKNNSDAI